jgi:predicted RNase H-like nuclease
MRFIGVDGCKAGWIAIEIDDVGFVAAHLAPTIIDVPVGDVVAIDIPIGLTDAPREADVAARARASRSSSVFSTPRRELLEAVTYADARALAARSGGPSLSSQAYRLGPKILEVDAWVASAGCRVAEVHPEVSFVEMNGGRKLAWSKKSWNGMRQRAGLLEAHGVVVPDDIDIAGSAGIDDVLDAAAAAWTARRIHRVEARRYPESSADGTAIWA